MVHDCTGDNLHQGQMVLEALVCSALAPTGMAEGSHDMTAPSPIYAPVSNDWVPPSGECNGVAMLQGCQPSVLEETMVAGSHIAGAAATQGCQFPAFKNDGPVAGSFFSPLDSLSSQVESLALGP
jgi:hypothetical protein